MAGKVNLLIGVLLASLYGCESDTKVLVEVSEFYQIAHSNLASDGECRAAAEYIRGLPPEIRLNVTRAIINDPDARIGYLGASLLIEQGHADEAIPALAAMIADGRVETQLHGRMGYDWAHSDDETLSLRMVIKISHYLLGNLENYKGEERIRIEQFLMGGMFNKSGKPFSRQEAARYISEWEKKLSKVQVPKMSP